MEIKRVYDFKKWEKRHVSLYHEELESLAKTLQAFNKLIFYDLGQSYLTHLKCLENVGMTFIKPIIFNDKPIISLEF